MRNRYCTLRTAVAVTTALVFSPAVARADVIVDWNMTMLGTFTGLSPFMSARFAAITHLAVFEAVNAITRDYEPYLGTIEAPVGASAEAAAAAAAHSVLTFYFPGRTTELDAALAASLIAVPDGPAEIDGIAVGEAAAAAMIALRANDGSSTPAFYVAPPPAPGAWQPTPSCSAAGGANFHWRHVTPFGVPAIEGFRAAPPPSLVDGGYSKDFVEVKAVGADDSVRRPQDRTDVAQFFAAFSPVSLANSAARQVSTAQGQSLSENARAFALVNIALNDAAVAVFDTKYHYNLWRPETAIRGADTDSNPKTDQDGVFKPLIVTPCFPGYPSAHGTLSSAAREVLERLYGPSGHDITFSNPLRPGVILHYTDFKSIVADVDDARVFGGIHFRFDQEAGTRQGQRVGEYVYKHNLGRVHPR